MNHQYIQANGLRFHYVEEGSGALLILLHGFPECWYGWRHQIPELSKQFHVVAPDMRGYNLSDKPTKVSAYQMEHLAADVAALIKALGYEKAYVAGHDWGAAVAWAVAAYHPHVVEKLAILNVPHPEEMKRAFLQFNLKQWMRSWYIFFFQLPFLPEWVVGTKTFFSRTFTSMTTNPNAFTEQDIAVYEEAYKQPGAVKGTIAYYRAAFRSVMQKRTFPKIQCPVMVLWGVQDKALGVELTYNTANHCVHKPEIIYDEGSGHFVQHDNPAWVNRHLLRFLN